MGRPATQKELRNAWSQACRTIEDHAYAAGMRRCALETAFGAGDGSGRVWRSWRSGSRVPVEWRRRAVIAEAARRGWIKTSSGSDVLPAAPAPQDIPSPLPAPPRPHIQALLGEDAKPDKQTTWWTASGASLAASALLADARQHGDISPAQRRAAKTPAIAKSWAEAVRRVARLLDEHDELAVHEGLRAAYLRQGCPREWNERSDIDGA